MNQQEIAKLILEGISKERFRLWHGEGGRFEKYITGEEHPTEDDILADIITIFKIPDDKEPEVSQQVSENTNSAIVDEICDTGIVLEDGRQLNFRDIANILHELARSVPELPTTRFYADSEKAFNRAGDIFEEMAEVGEGMIL